jgi:hypothetical protein
MMNKSQQLFDHAKNVIPGGVNSPVRAFNSVGGTPCFIKRAAGAYIYDEDDNAYIDYIGSWGPMKLKSPWQKKCVNWYRRWNHYAWSVQVLRRP